MLINESWGSWPTQSPRGEVTHFCGWPLRTETRPEKNTVCLRTISRSLFSGWKFGRNAIHTMKSTVELVVCCHLCWKRCAAVKLGIISHIFRVNRNPPTLENHRNPRHCSSGNTFSMVLMPASAWRNSLSWTNMEKRDGKKTQGEVVVVVVHFFVKHELYIGVSWNYMYKENSQ